MCGLVLTTRPRDPQSSAWRRAMHVLDCRGPDSHGQVHTSRYSAGHCRLEVIGLGDAGRQPYSEDPESDLLLFNGEIYNYRELAGTLGIRADSDTRVVYELLRRGMTDRLSGLRGMFAFIYWNSDRDMIVSGRDLFGIKPLFVSHGTDGDLSFGSVAASLMPLVDDAAVDDLAIAGFLATGYFPESASPLLAIQKCPPGTITTWRRRGSTWLVENTSLTIDAWPLTSPIDAVEDSVRAHLVSDVPVGVLLSGGVDSTLIASCAAEHVDELLTFSLVNPESPSIDESAYARHNAAVIGARHTEVPFRPADALETVRALVRSSGEPFGDPAYIPLAMLCARVAVDVKVVLAGEGADELFGGYRRYDVERLRSRTLTGLPLRHLGRVLRGGARYRRRAPSMSVRTWAHWAERDDYLAYSYLLSSEWQAVRASLPGAGDRSFARHQLAWSRPGPASVGMPSHRSFDVSQWLANVFLEKSDRASMLSGVEVRVPYLDPVVARAARAFEPTDSRKAPLRDGLLRRHPDIRLPRRKMGLSVDTAGLMAASGLDEYAHFALTDPHSIVRRFDRADTTALAERALLNPALQFRLAVLGLWQHEVLGHVAAA